MTPNFMMKLRDAPYWYLQRPLGNLRVKLIQMLPRSVKYWVLICATVELYFEEDNINREFTDFIDKLLVMDKLPVMDLIQYYQPNREKQ